MKITIKIAVLKAIAKLTNLKRCSVSFLSSVLLFCVFTTNASTISSIHFFGDSLTDSGALQYIAPDFCPPAPYADCRFSNGPVWAELVANELGFSAQTAYAGGTNWAIGGQRSDQVLSGQVASYLGSTNMLADSDGLYVIWAGANDNFQNDPFGTFDPLQSAQNIIDSIENLAMAGAMHFLVPNLPIADTWSFIFNDALANGIGSLSADLEVIEFDALSFFADVTNNPQNYGLVDSITPCFTGFSVCDNPDQYALWDNVHPTAAGHRLIAAAVLEAIEPVNVPAPVGFAILGAICLMFTKRK